MLKYDRNKETQEVWRLEYEFKDTVCHQVYSTFTESTLSKKLLKGFETSKEEDK
jgi:hypothetical protein